MRDFLPCHLIYEDRHFNTFLQNGIIVDSGVLLEFIKLRHKQEYKKDMLTEKEKTLLARLERFLSIGHKYITPHILAELSNLLNKLCTSGSPDFCNCIALTKCKLNENDYYEISIKKEEILATDTVANFGVTDTAILLASKKDKKIILTNDGPFSTECKHNQNLPALHLGDLESLFLTIESLKN